MAHKEGHRSHDLTWLRAAVLGANDGLISTSSLVVGMASAHVESGGVFLAASAGMIAGALSMAAGEYVSVSSQADTERADLDREARELEDAPEWERLELTYIYMQRGLPENLASEVAVRLMEHDALDAHAQDELGIHERTRARPFQAAWASAAAFAAGALLPVLLAAFLPVGWMIAVVSGSSLVLLFVLGGTAARLGGASPLRGALRVAFWGALAMAGTALVGTLFGAIV